MAHAAASLSLDTIGRDAEILTLDGAFDLSNAPEFEHRMADALDAGRPSVVIDLRGVSFLDSAMLRALVKALGQAEERNGPGSLRLVRPNPGVWKLFVITGLSVLFPAFPALRDALAELTPHA